MIRTCVVTGYGINADRELAEAFARAGSAVDAVHAQDVMDRPELIDRFAILAFPGGFSFGDHLGSGLVLAHLFKQRVRERLERFLAAGGLVLGVCNGFQVLVKMGLLPNTSGDWTQEASLVHNESGLFEDSWVEVAFDADSRCVWTAGLPSMELPIRHGEGRFIAASEEAMRSLVERKLVAARYAGRNPNGSDGSVAGLSDPSGRVFGLMPHPEAFLFPEQHPRWTRERVDRGWGLELFKRGVRAASQ